MSPPLVVIFLYLLFSISTNGELQTDICVVPTESCGPFIPPMPTSYMAKMEITEPLINTTKYATEYFDGYNLRGAITWRLEGEENRILYDGVAKTLIKVKGWTPTDPFETSAQCIVSDFIYTRDNFLFDVDTDSKSVSHLAIIGGLLRYNPDLRFEYNNYTKPYVRGIKADEWRSCVYIPKVDGTFNIVFYWSDLGSELLSPSGEKTVPLKTEIVGRYKPVLEKDEYKDVILVTNFIWFESSIQLNDEWFQPPHGVFCQNDKKSKLFPTFPQVFSVYMESHLQIEGSDNVNSVNQKLWYHLPAKLQRIDQYVAGRDLSTVTDYSTGISYFIHVYTGECKISEPTNFHFPKADELFLMDTKQLEYLGKYVIRDRLCDTWSGKVNNLVIEWSFLDETWHQIDKDGVVTQTPVQTVLINHKPTGAERTTINYFHFDPNDEEFPFEIDSCFSPETRKIFQISFSITFDESLINFVSFARKCRIVLAREIQVSLLRISQVQAEYNKQSIVVQFNLLNTTVAPNAKDVDISTAVENLENAVHMNSLIVNGGRLPNTQEVLYLTARPDSLIELDKDDPCSRNDVMERRKRSQPETVGQSKDVIDLWTTGQLVGLGFGLFAIGTVLGVIGMLILLLRLEPRINRRTETIDDGIQLTTTSE